MEYINKLQREVKQPRCVLVDHICPRNLCLHIKISCFTNSEGEKTGKNNLKNLRQLQNYKTKDLITVGGKLSLYAQAILT